mmetsp:Transcript_57655/g.172017  ORF Transcript_57655/g.172017 Transcript_57655/m.172017 type:complete len:82 (+) Transcript_57655:1307-1552(+)
MDHHELFSGDAFACVKTQKRVASLEVGGCTKADGVPCTIIVDTVCACMILVDFTVFSKFFFTVFLPVKEEPSHYCTRDVGG